MMLCTQPDCDAPRHARGLCKKHYHRWLRYRDPTVQKRKLPWLKSYYKRSEAVSEQLELSL